MAAGETMKAIRVKLSADQQAALEQLYHTTRDVRVRTRAQMILLSSEQEMVAHAIGRIVRESADSVVRWLKRYMAEGVAGLYDLPRSGAPSQINAAFTEQLVNAVRRRPRSLGQPFSLWTLQRLADYMAEQTGIRVSDDTIRRQRLSHAIVLSRPQHKVSSPDPEYMVKKRRLKTHETG
jgi:transposase